MVCNKCGKQLEENALFCTDCGSAVSAETTQILKENKITEKDLPEQYRPMGAWAYFGLQLLFSVPIVGLVFLIVFSFSKGNLNRRSFARSYWCGALIVGILLAVVLTILIATGGMIDLLEGDYF